MENIKGHDENPFTENIGTKIKSIDFPFDRGGEKKNKVDYHVVIKVDSLSIGKIQSKISFSPV